MKVIVAAAFVLCGQIVFASSVSAAVINLSPSTITLTEGQSQLVTISLSEPIICQVMDNTCNVVITPVFTDPSRLTATPSVITIPYTQWLQPFTFTVTAIDDQTYNGNLENAISFATQSNSEFYDAFVPTLSLTVAGNDPAPAEVQAPQLVSQVTTGLASSGDNILIWSSVCGILFIAAVSLSLWHKRPIGKGKT